MYLEPCLKGGTKHGPLQQLSIFNTCQMKESIHSIESGSLSSELLGWISFCIFGPKSLTMKLTPKEKKKAAMIRSVKEFTFSTENGSIRL